MSEEESLLPSLEGEVQFSLINYSPKQVTFQNEDELINRISGYFDFCNTNSKSPTFTGLALHLGFSRTKLKNFPTNHPESPFAKIIEKAMQYIIDYAEQQLFSPKSSAGVIFWLKNNDEWVDKTDLQLSHAKTIGEIVDEINLKNKSPIEYEDPATPSQFQNLLPHESDTTKQGKFNTNS